MVQAFRDASNTPRHRYMVTPNRNHELGAYLYCEVPIIRPYRTYNSTVIAELQQHSSGTYQSHDSQQQLRSRILDSNADLLLFVVALRGTWREPPCSAGRRTCSTRYETKAVLSTYALSPPVRLVCFGSLLPRIGIGTSITYGIPERINHPNIRVTSKFH